MKYSSGFIIAIVILIVVVILAVHATATGFVPYNPSTIFSNQSAFEGFARMPSHLKYGTYPGNVAIDQLVSRDITPPKNGSSYPVWGVGGLFPSPNAPEPILDIYANAPGSLSEACHATSGGISNSMGYLCLNKNQILMAATRGGNQSYPAQIGNSML
jgi:hypothetical protein